MEYPVRVHGLVLAEMFLATWLSIAGWLLGLFAVGVGIFFAASSSDASSLFAPGVAGGMLISATIVTGLMLIVAGAGVRQNRSALDLGLGLLLLISLGWAAGAVHPFRWPNLVVAFAFISVFLFLSFFRRLTIRTRFKPRFLSLRQFETLIQIIDTVIETDGRAGANPIDGAIRVDHLLARIDAPARDDIRRLLFVTEWILPLLIFKPVPFTVLGSNDRRRAVERVVDSRFGLLRDVARVFKTAGCVGYYGSPGALNEIGYIPFDRRPRSAGVDQAPMVHTEPVIWAD